MDLNQIGTLIKSLREEKQLTQKQLGDKLGVSEKTISKWETGNGLPDISLLESISNLLSISLSELFMGEKITNKNTSSNMFNTLFYVCPVCHNVITSLGEASISCHGINLKKLDYEESDLAEIEKVEDEYFININHEMSKENYISFICGVANDRIEMVKLYPEGNAQCRLKIAGSRFIYFYDIKNGLFRQKIKR